MTSNIRQEFEKALEEYLSPINQFTPKQIALWAAKWMAERCALISDDKTKGFQSETSDVISYEIRQLAKELQ